MRQALFFLVLILVTFRLCAAPLAETQISGEKRVVVVTGASSGIGKGLVEALAQDGRFVVYGGTRKTELVGKKSGYTMIELNPAKTASVQKAIGSILRQESRLDVLVNNAAYMILGSVESIDPDTQLADLFDVNVLGYVRTIRAVVPAMRNQKSGLIVNVSSVQAFDPRSLQESYSATRSAIETLSLGESAYLKDYGINLVLFEPGAVNTNIGRNARMGNIKVAGDLAGRRAKQLAVMMENRLASGASVEEVAGKIVALINSPDPDFRNQMNDAGKKRAGDVYVDPTGNQQRNKVRTGYEKFVQEWGSEQEKAVGKAVKVEVDSR